MHGRVAIYDTADAVIIHVPLKKSFAGRLGFALSVFAVLVFGFIAVLPISGVIVGAVTGALVPFALIWSGCAIFGLAFAAYQMLWNRVSPEWMRVTRNRLEICRAAQKKRNHTAYDAALIDDLGTCPKPGYWTRRMHKGYQSRFDCPARFKAVQFRCYGVLRGFGQRISDAQSWAMYDAIVSRFPNYRAKRLAERVAGMRSERSDAEVPDPRRPFQ